MRVIQFEQPGEGRRVGVVTGDVVRDITAARPEITSVVAAFHAARAAGTSLSDYFAKALDGCEVELPYAALLGNTSLADGPILRAPLDQPDPHHTLITGTGLTHLGSMESRDQMHAEVAAADAEQLTDSKKMFQMGLAGGKPVAGERGAMPEWFFKGNGFNLRAHNEPLDIPAHAPDGGEEPELVGCYVVDNEGMPHRLGFALGNEWSDHRTENVNYLYLAPSKLRTCAVGPELVLDCDFEEIHLRCTVTRDGETIYDSGPLLSGQQHMCHTLANCEDHHFKYAQHRVPGDVHLHYFGTSKLSYSERDWQYAEGDVIRIEAPDFSASLVNRVRRATESADPFRVARG